MNCFIKKLNEIVDNPSLRKLGEGVINVTDADNNVFRLLRANDTRVTLRVTGDLVVTEDPNNVRVFIANGSGNIYFPQNDVTTFIVTLPCFNITWEDVASCVNLKVLTVSSSVVKGVSQLSEIANAFPSLTKIDLRDSDAIWEGNINDLPNTLTEYRINDANSKIIGSFDSFGNKPLTVIGGFRYASVAGTIEGFVATARKPIVQGGAGRETGSISLLSTYGWNYITFNGESLPGGSNVTLSWTANTITLNGVTIDA